MSQSPTVQAVHRNKAKKLHTQTIRRSLPTPTSVVGAKRLSGRPKKNPNATPANRVGGIDKSAKPRKSKRAASIESWSGDGMESDEEVVALSEDHSDDFVSEDPSGDDMEEDELSMSDMTLELTQRHRSMRIEAVMIPNWNASSRTRSTLSESSRRDAVPSAVGAVAEEEYSNTLDVIVVDVKEVAMELKVATQMETMNEMTIDSGLDRDGAEEDTDEATGILDLSTARTEIRSLRDNNQQLLTELQMKRAANVRLRASLGRRGVICVLMLNLAFWWTRG